MAKSSKSCKYSGHMRIMNKVNFTKEIYESAKNKAHGEHKPKSYACSCLKQCMCQK